MAENDDYMAGLGRAGKTEQEFVDKAKGGGSILDEPKKDWGTSASFRRRDQERRELNKIKHERAREQRAARKGYRDMVRSGEGLKAAALLKEIKAKDPSFNLGRGMTQHGDDDVEAGIIHTQRQVALENEARRRGQLTGDQLELEKELKEKLDKGTITNAERERLFKQNPGAKTAHERRKLLNDLTKEDLEERLRVTSNKGETEGRKKGGEGGEGKGGKEEPDEVVGVDPFTGEKITRGEIAAQVESYGKDPVAKAVADAEEIRRGEEEAGATGDPGLTGEPGETGESAVPVTTEDLSAEGQADVEEFDELMSNPAEPVTEAADDIVSDSLSPQQQRDLQYYAELAGPSAADTQAIENYRNFISERGFSTGMTAEDAERFGELPPKMSKLMNELKDAHDKALDRTKPMTELQRVQETVRAFTPGFETGSGPNGTLTVEDKAKRAAATRVRLTPEKRADLAATRKFYEEGGYEYTDPDTGEVTRSATQEGLSQKLGDIGERAENIKRIPGAEERQEIFARMAEKKEQAEFRKEIIAQAREIDGPKLRPGLNLSLEEERHMQSLTGKDFLERRSDREERKETEAIERRARVRVSMEARKPETLASARKKLSEGTRLLPEERKALEGAGAKIYDPGKRRTKPWTISESIGRPRWWD